MDLKEIIAIVTVFAICPLRWGYIFLRRAKTKRMNYRCLAPVFSVAISDSSGNVVNKYAFDALGKVLSEEEAIPNPFKHVGQFGVMDEGNGLFYMRARYYDPEVGRFINKDPIGFADGDLNLYGYVANNPVNRIDPSGLIWEGTIGVNGTLGGSPFILPALFLGGERVLD